MVRLEKDSGVICLEMMKKFQDAGFRVAEHPVHHYHRAHGQSQFFNFPRVVRTLVDVHQAVVAAGRAPRAPQAAAGAAAAAPQKPR